MKVNRAASWVSSWGCVELHNGAVPTSEIKKCVYFWKLCVAFWRDCVCMAAVNVRPGSVRELRVRTEQMNKQKSPNMSLKQTLTVKHYMDLFAFPARFRFFFPGI